MESQKGVRDSEEHSAPKSPDFGEREEAIEEWSKPAGLKNRKPSGEEKLLPEFL